MRVEVLISCMHQKDASIVARTNVQSDVLVVNQCDRDGYDEFTFINKSGKSCLARIIHTTERGLSKSRNMALKNAKGDVCLICDDDEVMEDDYVEKIVVAFEKYQKEQIIAFRLIHPSRKFSEKTYRVGFLQTAGLGSWQIAFRRMEIVGKVTFCEKMGAGTGNGGGEENKFLVDCIKLGLKIRYVPSLIASVKQTESTWFHGYTQQYWISRGWTAKMIYGIFFGYIYIWYIVLFRNRRIDKTNNRFHQLVWLHRGFVENR